MAEILSYNFQSQFFYKCVLSISKVSHRQVLSLKWWYKNVKVDKFLKLLKKEHSYIYTSNWSIKI